MTQRDVRLLSMLVILVTLTSDRAVARAEDDAWASAPGTAGGAIVLKTAMATDKDENPAAAGKAAAAALKQAMGETPLKAVIVSEAFEDQENKEKLLQGVCSQLPKQIVVGQATYGSFTQAGCATADSVCLLGIGGEGIGVSAALVTELGTSKLIVDKDRTQIAQRLQAAGTKLTNKLRRSDRDRLLVLLADAHAPKNQYLVDGVQEVVGKKFPITGGCANKNAGQTLVYFGGKAYADSAVAVMLSGDFQVSLAGRQAKENDAVIATANQSAAAALTGLKGKPLAALAFDCAGRKGKLKNIADELTSFQKAIGTELGLFGCYCAGEMGPLDVEDKPADTLSGGGGWHVMFTVLGR